MDNEYWNLFWMTGLPSAWVLSHGRSEISSQREGMAPEVPLGPTVCEPSVPGNMPGNPKNLY